MLVLGLGCLSFVIFILYDFNQIRANLLWLKPLFLIGTALLVAVSCWMVAIPHEADYKVSFIVFVLFLVLAIVNLILLIYTLFFAIPFYQAYVEGNKQDLCREGIYSLSRHPGVLFLFAFYLFLGISLGKPIIITAAFVFTLMNLGYAYLQDRYFFPKSFVGYENYRTTTNFVVPSINSIKTCIRYYVYHEASQG
jgi:protein-S-isoprenylcysteine O-methyltransferase Ste14